MRWTRSGEAHAATRVSTITGPSHRACGRFGEPGPRPLGMREISFPPFLPVLQTSSGSRGAGRVPRMDHRRGPPRGAIEIGKSGALHFVRHPLSRPRRPSFPDLRAEWRFTINSRNRPNGDPAARAPLAWHVTCTPPRSLRLARTRDLPACSSGRRQRPHRRAARHERRDGGDETEALTTLVRGALAPSHAAGAAFSIGFAAGYPPPTDGVGMSDEDDGDRESIRKGVSSPSTE